jgi:hypothetical protein
MEDLEKRAIGKVMRRLIPFLIVCYFVAYLDRVNVCFSNRPFEVKHFQTIRQCSVDVARGLVFLFGIGTRALASWDSRTRQNNLYRGLVVSSNGRFKRTCELTWSIVPRGTSFHSPQRDILPLQSISPD